MNKTNIFSGLRDFFILWSSQSVSGLGTAMTNFALIIWVYNQKGTASSITLLSICSLVPSIVFSLAAGTLADLWDKKRIMLLADLMAAIGTAAMLILHITDNLQIWHRLGRDYFGTRIQERTACVRRVENCFGHSVLLRIILFFAFINFLAKMGVRNAARIDSRQDRRESGFTRRRTCRSSSHGKRLYNGAAFVPINTESSTLLLSSD